MDGWGAVVLGVEILLLVAGWLLFQQAKSDLTARAAQMPVLSEVRALQKSIAGLLEQLKLESSQTSTQLEARCVEARDLLAALDRRLQEARSLPVPPRVEVSAAPMPSARPMGGEGANGSAEPGVTAPPLPVRTEPARTEPARTEPARTEPERRVRRSPSDETTAPAGAPAPLPGHDRIYALSDSGLPPAQIAQETGMSEGEVELILGLRARIS